MSAEALSRSREISKAVTDALGGRGLFGVELFVKGDMVWGFGNALQSAFLKRNHGPQGRPSKVRAVTACFRFLMSFLNKHCKKEMIDLITRINGNIRNSKRKTRPPQNCTQHAMNREYGTYLIDIQPPLQVWFRKTAHNTR
jgi:hypothetical protein